MTDRAIVAPASRNSPCPCGSGLRYKECHGSLGGGGPRATAAERTTSTYRAPGYEWAHLDAAARDACGALMEAALRHQTSDRHDEAAAAYREVLARAPDTHDALHMLGVIELGRQNLDEAERLIRAALALRPTYSAIEHNLRLIGDARVARLRAQPEQLAERALPILAELALAGPERSSLRSTAASASATAIHLIGRVGGDEDDAWLLRRLCEILESRRVSVWTTDADAAAAGGGIRATPIDGAVGALPRGGVHVYVGLDFDCSGWIRRAAADRVVAIPVGATPTLCLDQLRAIAHDGARRVELAVLSRAMAARFGEGHHVVAPPHEPVEAIVPAPEAPIYGEWRIEEPPAWPVGISGQHRQSVVQPADMAFIRSVVATAGCLHVRDPGRIRYALGADRRVRFYARAECSLATFLSALRCYVHRVDTWWNEGVGRELFSAMALGIPVLCPRGSLYADFFDDGVDGMLYGSVDEALVCLTELRRAPAFAASIGRAARERIARVFAPAEIATAWRRLVPGVGGGLQEPVTFDPAAPLAARAFP